MAVSELDRPVWQRITRAIEARGALHFTLIDPDRHEEADARQIARTVSAAGTDAILAGTSLSLSPAFRQQIAAIREGAAVPVILFPAHAGQVIPEVDAILFMSLLSGRNPQYLIDEQVRGAPLVKACRIEPIPVGYLLIESGRTTTVEFMSGTRPIPAHKPEIVVAHALAAECLGMRLVYLEAGSGAERPVPRAVVEAVSRATALPVVVGGGITEPETAADLVRAGASIVVTGNVLERAGGTEGAARFARAIHDAGRERRSRERAPACR